jgi:hypothetical protein
MFNVQNTTHLIEELKENPYSHNLRFASFDITDMYTNMYTNMHTNMHTNIPTGELIRITEKACQNNCIESNLKFDIIKLINTILDQNYFQFHGKTYIQSEGGPQHPQLYPKFIYST